MCCRISHSGSGYESHPAVASPQRPETKLREREREGEGRERQQDESRRENSGSETESALYLTRE